MDGNGVKAIFPFLLMLATTTIIASVDSGGIRPGLTDVEWYERIKKMTLVRNLQRQQFVKCPSQCICYQDGVALVTRCMFLRLRKIPSPTIDGKTQRLWVEPWNYFSFNFDEKKSGLIFFSSRHNLLYVGCLFAHVSFFSILFPEKLSSWLDWSAWLNPSFSPSRKIRIILHWQWTLLGKHCTIQAMKRRLSCCCPAPTRL